MLLNGVIKVVKINVSLVKAFNIFIMLSSHNPNPASVAGTVWLNPCSRSAAGSVDPHS